jgi:hypothetical protein
LQKLGGEIKMFKTVNGRTVPHYPTRDAAVAEMQKPTSESKTALAQSIIAYFLQELNGRNPELTESSQALILTPVIVLDTTPPSAAETAIYQIQYGVAPSAHCNISPSNIVRLSMIESRLETVWDGRERLTLQVDDDGVERLFITSLAGVIYPNLYSGSQSKEVLNETVA